jgi:hypothetical protein
MRSEDVFWRATWGCRFWIPAPNKSQYFTSSLHHQHNIDIILKWFVQSKMSRPTVWQSRSLLDTMSTILSLNSPTTLLICTSKMALVKTMFDALPSKEMHPLLIPTLESLEQSSRVQVHFCDSLPGLHARISVLSGHCRHLVLLYPLTLHVDLSAHSAQALAKTVASAVDASARLGAQLHLAEPTSTIQKASLDHDTYTELQDTTDFQQTHSDPWDQHLPILGAIASRLGNERGLVKRTVSARQVVSRWCTWEQIASDDS